MFIFLFLFFLHACLCEQFVVSCASRAPLAERSAVNRQVLGSILKKKLQVAERPCHVPIPTFEKNEKKKQKKSAFSPNRKTRAESHAIDATRHLYTLQYPVWNLSRLQMIHGSSNLALLCAPRKCVWSWPEGYRNFNR